MGNNILKRYYFDFGGRAKINRFILAATNRTMAEHAHIYNDTHSPYCTHIRCSFRNILEP